MKNVRKHGRWSGRKGRVGAGQCELVRVGAG
jgi:hypothetical protein